MPEYPFETYGSVGAVGADANPFICGGSSHGPNPVAGECYTFEDGAWKNVFNMTGPRPCWRSIEMAPRRYVGSFDALFYILLGR